MWKFYSPCPQKASLILVLPIIEAKNLRISFNLILIYQKLHLFVTTTLIQKHITLLPLQSNIYYTFTKHSAKHHTCIYFHNNPKGQLLISIDEESEAKRDHVIYPQLQSVTKVNLTSESMFLTTTILLLINESDFSNGSYTLSKKTTYLLPKKIQYALTVSLTFSRKRGREERGPVLSPFVRLQNNSQWCQCPPKHFKILC